MVNIDRLLEIMNIYSPSNFESKFVEYLLTLEYNHFKPKLTPNGTLIFESDNKNSKKETILLDAHIDQVHYRIKNILHDGLIVAQSVGFDSDTFIGLEVLVLSFKGEPIKGVIVSYPPHLPGEGDVSNPNYAYIDTGLTREELRTRILPGDPIVFTTKPQKFGNKSVMGQGLDNKVGVILLIELMDYFDKNIEKLNYHTFFNFSTKEEIGNVSVDHVDDVLINKMLIIDTDTAIDLSTMSDDELGSDIYCGRGPTISRNHSDSPIIFKEIHTIAKKNKIPIQVTYTDGFGESNLFEYAKFINSLTQFIGVPIRSMHSPVETVNIIDIENTFKLLKLYLQK